MDGGITGKARWQFWIDRGGTFTDVVGRPALQQWTACTRSDKLLLTLKIR